jgi:hypothetical protein
MDTAQKLRLESLLLGLGGGMLGGLLVYLVFSASGEKAAQMNLVGTILLVIPTAVVAWMTIKTARATFISAEATRQNASVAKEFARSQVILQISTEYASRDILEAMKTLRQWKEINGENFAKAFAEKRRNDLRWENDYFRRIISHHFYKIYQLSKSKFIDTEFLAVLLDAGRIDFLLDVLKPIEFQILKSVPNYDRAKQQFAEEMFDFFENLRHQLMKKYAYS